MSFHELREALVCAFSDGVINEEEFLILYEEYESTNLNFPHWEYEPFSIDNFDISEGRAEFRVDKDDIPLLVKGQMNQKFDIFHFSSILVKYV